MKWRIEYENDVGADGDGFWEWWEVTDGDRIFKTGTESDAKWLCGLLNSHSRLSFANAESEALT
jgi:hypothetical protein